MSKTLTVKTIPILRMDCPTCIPLLEKEVAKLEGVETVRGGYMSKILRVTYDPGVTQLAEIEAAVERVGYRIAYKKYPGALSRLRGFLKKEAEVELSSLTDSDFPGKVLHASRTAVVLFSSPTCPTCRVFKPGFLALADKLGGEADFFEMDIEATETWRDYDILSIPQVIIFRAGKVSERFTAMPVAAEIEKALGA
ncbi:cation transporter [Candidatus Bathyarchaeota archaeon]|nr:cation transporter [Candidatus Bathyarchaeota archaeon]MBL7079912.1 cation transporter [Candidatus Bathyarchaeota archaeon]